MMSRFEFSFPPSGVTAFLALFLAIVFMVFVPDDAVSEPIRIDAAPIPLDTAQPDHAVVGALRYLGGLHLGSDHPSFGGLSGLGSNADGTLLLAVTDRGDRLELVPAYDDHGNLTGIIGAELTPLIGLDGDALTLKRDSDAESLSPGANGEIIISFERHHRLLRYTPNAVAPSPVPSPDGLSDAPNNGGIEALTRLADGRLLAITEKMGTKGQRVGWISDRNGWSPLTYTIPDGYNPTGATTLPGGDVLVLERFYSFIDGSKARIRRIAEHSIEPGAVLEGDLVAELKPPLTVDNMEGITARPADSATPNGKAIVYLVSDDNFDSPEQRTLLMMFELEE